MKLVRFAIFRLFSCILEGNKQVFSSRPAILLKARYHWESRIFFRSFWDQSSFRPCCQPYIYSLGVFDLSSLYCSRHLLVTALPTGKEINENTEDFKKKLNLKTITMIQPVSLPVYSQQRRPQWLMIQLYWMKSKIACLSKLCVLLSVRLPLYNFFTFYLKVISLQTDREMEIFWIIWRNFS